jgi:hypothetical protein
MYATAQRVQDQQGHTEIHAFLHRHDNANNRFPDDPRTVPQSAPGRLEWQDPHHYVKPGGNAVLSYLDLIVREERWSADWTASLQNLARQTGQVKVPFEAQVGPVLVMFNAAEDHRDAGEFKSLLEVALHAVSRAVE